MKWTITTISFFALATALATPVSRPAWASADALFGSTAATESELSAIRGGFATADGLLVSFGIDRAIYVNGVLDTVNKFSVDLAGSNGQPQSALTTSPGDNPVRLVQIGPSGSNVFVPAKNLTGMLPGGFTVIQNTLNRQVVSDVTTVNAAVTNTGLFRDMNLTSLLRQEMIRTLR